MEEKQHYITEVNRQNQFVLKAEIESLQKELDLIEQETNTFETLLRSQLAEELIEVQEYYTKNRSKPRKKND